MIETIPKSDILNVTETRFPDIENELRQSVKNDSAKVVILDDDPTGCQTVQDVPVLTVWDENSILKILQSAYPCFFILTNTRSLVEHEALLVVEEVTKMVTKISVSIKQKVTFISRSDSTLRGHYPAEPDKIAECTAMENPIHCLIPAFFQGGRYTLNDIHYVQEHDQLIPAHLTPFAKDKSFGFSTSELKAYVEEKTRGKTTHNDVLSISIEDIRIGGPDKVEKLILNTKKPVCIINAIDQNDLDIFALAARRAISKHRNLIFRTAASFINSFCAIPVKPNLNGIYLPKKGVNKGLYVIGSYVPKSSEQLDHLLKKTSIKKIEIPVQKIISAKADILSDFVEKAVNELSIGNQIAMYTSRNLLTGKNNADNLKIGRMVSDFLVSLVKSINQKTSLSFVLTKGGITSHVIAKEALKISQAIVTGQILPGVPVWEYTNSNGEKSSLIVFPGNVGTKSSMTEIYNKLTT